MSSYGPFQIVRNMVHSKQFDQFPQTMRFRVAESAANTFTEANINTNLPLNGKFVMEILKVQFQVEAELEPTLASGDAWQWALYDRTRATMPVLNDPGVIAKELGHSELTTSGQSSYEAKPPIDIGDGAGHGLLYGNERIFLAVEGTSQNAALEISVAITFRLVEVKAEELIGIIKNP